MYQPTVIITLWYSFELFFSAGRQLIFAGHWKWSGHYSSSLVSFDFNTMADYRVAELALSLSHLMVNCYPVPLSVSSLAGTTLCWTYHYSDKTMNWNEARRFCQENFTDLVVIQSQYENDYLVKMLPQKNSSPYYWIGITKKHKNETWTWVGNNSTWVGNDSWAEKEPNNNHVAEFCVEIYVNKGTNRGKWNDELCSKPKYPVCYQGRWSCF